MSDAQKPLSALAGSCAGTPDLSPCPDCGAAPARIRCECDHIGLRKQREMAAKDARVAQLEEALEYCAEHLELALARLGCPVESTNHRGNLSDRDSFGGSSAIEAARDKRIQREVHAAYIRSAGLTVDECDDRLGPSATIQDAEAWLAARYQEQRKAGAVVALRQFRAELARTWSWCQIADRLTDRAVAIERGETEVPR